MLRRRQDRSPPTAAAPHGQRLYAIGDVHGRFDLFEQLMAMIHADNSGRSRCRTTLILLGNVIDHGPRSAALMQRLHRWSQRSDRLVVLKGSREDMMVEAFSGRLNVLSVWLAAGGDRTLESWGVPPDLLAEGSAGKILDAARRLIPAHMIRWLDARPLCLTAGGYHFVHAGIRPGVPLERQQTEDLLWIEDEFLDHVGCHPRMVVHGHSTVADGPAVRSNRIAINTAAFRTGRLTALGLEAHERWFLST